MFDLMIVVIFIAIFATATVFGLKVYDEMDDMIQADADMSTEAKASSQNVRSEFPVFFDNAFMLAIILFWVMLLISSFLIDANPVFFIVTIILLVFTFLVGMMISNSYQDIVDDTDISSIAAEMPKTEWVMENMLLIIIGMGLSAGLVLYAKARS